MSSRKFIAVLGATGIQGGSVARSLLKDGTFAVHAITRNPDSVAARGNCYTPTYETLKIDGCHFAALQSQGAQIIKADSRDSVSLVKAFEGAYGVFALSICRIDFFSFCENSLLTTCEDWEPGVGGDGERAQGKALVDTSKAAGVKHFVWSTVDHTEFKAAHWESKADVDDYLKASGVPRTS